MCRFDGLSTDMADLTLSASNGMTPTLRLYLNAAVVGGAISMTEIGTTGEFYADVPSGTAAGEYLVVFYNGTNKLTSGILQWDGTKEVVPSGATAEDVWLYSSRTLTSVAPPTLTQIESSTILAKEATVAAIKAKTDTLINTNIDGLATSAQAVDIKAAVDLSVALSA